MIKDRFREIVNGFAGKHVIVLGDLMVDEYLWGKATRISPESPVMVVDVERESSVPGGAANVVNNLLALGARVSVIGVVGDDEAGRLLIQALKDEGADVSGIVADPSRPTTRKTRVVAHSQQVLRVDREQTHPIDAQVTEKLIRRLQEEISSAQAVLVSDYNKGVLTPDVARQAVQAARGKGIFLTANPKPSSARSLAGAHILQLNQVESEMAATILGIEGMASASPDAAGTALSQRLGVDTLIITRGAKGLMLYPSSGEPHHVPPHPVEVYDAAGAGDTVISTLTLGLVSGASAEEAAVIANHAAACVVRKVGVATVSAEEILADWKIE
jgi:rfaE bifunctional protein kinase chain/domain